MGKGSKRRRAPALCLARPKPRPVPNPSSHHLLDPSLQAMRGRNTVSSSGFTSSTDATSAPSYRNQGSNAGLDPGLHQASRLDLISEQGTGSDPERGALSASQAWAAAVDGAVREIEATQASAPPLSLLLDEEAARAVAGGDLQGSPEHCEPQRLAASVHIQVLAEGEPLPAHWWMPGTADSLSSAAAAGNGVRHSADGNSIRPGQGPSGERGASRQGFSMRRVRGGRSTGPERGPLSQSTPQLPAAVLEAARGAAGAPAHE